MNCHDQLREMRAHQSGKWCERILSQMAYLQKLYVVEKKEPNVLFMQSSRGIIPCIQRKRSAHKGGLSSL